jgi:hypothetical protein
MTGPHTVATSLHSFIRNPDKLRAPRGPVQTDVTFTATQSSQSPSKTNSSHDCSSQRALRNFDVCSHTSEIFPLFPNPLSPPASLPMFPQTLSRAVGLASFLLSALPFCPLFSHTKMSQSYPKQMPNSVPCFSHLSFLATELEAWGWRRRHGEGAE